MLNVSPFIFLDDACISHTVHQMNHLKLNDQQPKIYACADLSVLPLDLTWDTSFITKTLL